MFKIFIHLLLIIIPCISFGQSGQLSISRVDLMPDLPEPLLIRDWDKVTQDYDHLLFDFMLTGQYLPLGRFGTEGQFNYPGNTPVFLDSYVGADDHLNQAEAINIIPAVVGASLIGIDKSNQQGTNWVAPMKDFFNRKNGQNVYLNGYSTTSGDDWWYDVMPNVYFYQLKSLYPHGAPEFPSQFITVADRWLSCIKQLGGSATPWTIPDMNYRAFNLSTGLPLNSGVPEPESAGSIAWILYNAYTVTHERKYFEGAQMALDFLLSVDSNPSYELQLAYGTLTAARTNAVEGTGYSVQKLLDWCFNRGELRNWGVIVGKWGDFEVSGLVGEANDEGNDYAFVMNGFQQAAALAPLPKYDKRYARAIAKWILNLTNASRLFYWNALPAEHQDSYEWASSFDPVACIPHESMKETYNGLSPFITGDAIRGGWAATNLSLYSGSSVGYLASVVNKTNIPEILQIDLNATDFYGDDSLPAFLYFNPTQTSKQVIIYLPGNSGVFDAITGTILSFEASDSLEISIPAGEVRLIRLYPSEIEPQAGNGRLYAGEDILDYHFNYEYPETLRVKALSVERDSVVVNSLFKVYCEPGNSDSGGPVQFEWFVDGTLIDNMFESQLLLTAPESPKQLWVKCRISANDKFAVDSIKITITDHIPTPPVVRGIHAEMKYAITGGTNTFSVIVEPQHGETFEYLWNASSGVINQNKDSVVSWIAPESPGIATIGLTVTNQELLSTTVLIDALIKDTNMAVQSPLIWYPFDENDNNAVEDRFHATVVGALKTEDARNIPSLAYRFTDGQNIIYTANHDDLNFTDAVSLSCWIKFEQFGSERFIVSHGSWQQRYKLSVTPEGFFRWTVKTSSGVADLDGSSAIELNRYYHVCALYTGYSMELYIDGFLDTFKSHNGIILTTIKPFTIGRMDNTETLYSLRGSIDEVKLWDKEIPIPQIEQLRNQWALQTSTTNFERIAKIYPNPAYETINVVFTKEFRIKHIYLYKSDGGEIPNIPVSYHGAGFVAGVSGLPAGIYFLRIISYEGQAITGKIVIRQ